MRSPLGRSLGTIFVATHPDRGQVVVGWYANVWLTSVRRQGETVALPTRLTQPHYLPDPPDLSDLPDLPDPPDPRLPDLLDPSAPSISPRSVSKFLSSSGSTSINRGERRSSLGVSSNIGSPPKRWSL